MAVDQYAGRGQKGTVWQSEPGRNLTISMLLTPTFLDPQRQFSLTVAVSLAIVRWLESVLRRPVRVKWPNDLYVGDKKIGGILIENLLQGRRWKSAIVGIGINVNQTAFPSAIDRHTTSIKQLLHRESVITGLLEGLRVFIHREYSALQEGRSAEQLAEYTQHLYRLGERHPFLVDGVRVEGVLIGVTETGRLQLDFNGHMVDFDIKEVGFVI